MPVKMDDPGRRYVELELDVHGTPEEVWEAIATGPGISSWFTPTTVEERVGGKMQFDLGPDLQAPATVTRWEPPSLFAYEERDWMPGAPPLATEITVLAQAGGTCRVRLVHSLFASDTSWDDQLDSFESGWPSFFEILQARMARFRGEPAAVVRVIRSIDISETEAWQALTRALGMKNAGERLSPEPGVPLISGTVRRIGVRKHPEAVVDLDQPAPGIAIMSAYRWAEQGSVSMSLYLFGRHAAAVAERERPRWQEWMVGITQPA
jgi:uncharacterized protein YndB with AHSA1/START domain